MYVTILDFQSGRVIINKYEPEHDERDMEEIIKEELNHSNFQYMCTNDLMLTINNTD